MSLSWALNSSQSGHFLFAWYFQAVRGKKNEMVLKPKSLYQDWNKHFETKIELWIQFKSCWLSSCVSLFVSQYCKLIHWVWNNEVCIDVLSYVRPCSKMAPIFFLVIKQKKRLWLCSLDVGALYLWNVF